MIEKKIRINREKIPHILRKGHTHQSELFTLKYFVTNEKISKYRTIVSKKIARKAVDRNKIRRRILESIRLNHQKLADLKKGFEIVFIPKKSITEASFLQICEDIAKIMENNKFLNTTNEKPQ
ncbi:ribonuclease P protein component [Patescibacteria group bacterium]